MNKTLYVGLDVHKDTIAVVVRDAMIAFLAATAEATRSAQQAGIEVAKAKQRFSGCKPSLDSGLA